MAIRIAITETEYCFLVEREYIISFAIARTQILYFAFTCLLEHLPSQASSYFSKSFFSLSS